MLNQSLGDKAFIICSRYKKKITKKGIKPILVKCPKNYSRIIVFQNSKKESIKCGLGIAAQSTNILRKKCEEF
jgi:hypothetical protein